MKREGSRSRVPHLKPEFPDERSYLSSRAPDAERKNKPAERQFRERRDGYESEEGEMHKKAAKNPRRKTAYDEDSEPDRKPKSKEKARFEEPRSRRKDESDDDEPPRRRKPKDEDAFYEPPRRRNTERRRRADYSDESDSEDDRRRRRSTDDRERRRRKDKDYDSYEPDSRDARRRRQEIYDRDQVARRSDKPRRHYSDDESYDRRRRDSRGDRREPREIKVGKYDIGPYVEKGQKHYKTFAPIVTPILMNLAKNYMGGKR